MSASDVGVEERDRIKNRRRVSNGPAHKIVRGFMDNIHPKYPYKTDSQYEKTDN